METRRFKVGELARRTGLTVRTLHHYDAIGLLSPSDQTISGHRLYGVDNVARLQKICSLRQLGFSLKEIRDLLDCSDCSMQHVVELHMQRLEDQIVRQKNLYQRLEAISSRLKSPKMVSVDTFLQTIKEIKMVEKFEKYYTPEQLDWLKQRAKDVGAERIHEVEQEWPVLIAEVRAEMQKGTDPSSERMQELAQRWNNLVAEFTGGNPEIEQALAGMYRQEPTIANQEKGVDLDTDIFSYVNKAMSSANG